MSAPNSTDAPLDLIAKPFNWLLGLAVGIAFVRGRNRIADWWISLVGGGHAYRRFLVWFIAFQGVVYAISAVVSGVLWLV